MLRGAALVDLNGLLRRASTTGIVYQGARYTNAFITGGLFSLDGIHPTRTGHALIANAFIDAIDLKFGEVIPHVDVQRIASHDLWVGNRFRPAGEAPFGLIGVYLIVRGVVDLQP